MTYVHFANREAMIAFLEFVTKGLRAGWVIHFTTSHTNEHSRASIQFAAGMSSPPFPVGVDPYEETGEFDEEEETDVEKPPK